MSAAIHIPEDAHGTLNGYSNYACRCERCRAAYREYRRAWKARVARLPVPEDVHGTVNGYNNYACRCERCRAASREYDRARRRA